MVKEIKTVDELNSLPTATVVETGSGILYVKRIDGRWGGVSSLRARAEWLLDPDHSRQPIVVRYIPEAD